MWSVGQVGFKDLSDGLKGKDCGAMRPIKSVMGKLPVLVMTVVIRGEVNTKSITQSLLCTLCIPVNSHLIL